MKKIILLFFLMIIFEGVGFAQTNSSCPTFSVEEPSSVVKPFENVQFNVRFDKSFDVSNLECFWTVSSGKIIRGQGTFSITVSQTDASGSGLTATVRLKGLPPGCTSIASGITSPWDPPLNILVDEYSNISPREEIERLETLAKNLQNDPSAAALIIKSFPRNIGRRKAYQKLQEVLENLENFSITKEKISFGITYSNQEKTVLWLIPAGANIPEFKGEILNAKNLKEILGKKQKK